jgi:hypothetical protein
VSSRLRQGLRRRKFLAHEALQPDFETFISEKKLAFRVAGSHNRTPWRDATGRPRRPRLFTSLPSSLPHDRRSASLPECLPTVTGASDRDDHRDARSLGPRLIPLHSSVGKRLPKFAAWFLPCGTSVSALKASSAARSEEGSGLRRALNQTVGTRPGCGPGCEWTGTQFDMAMTDTAATPGPAVSSGI